MSSMEIAFQPLNLELTDILQALLLALVLGLVVAIVYRTSIPNRVVSPALQSSMVLLSVIGAMVMMVIGNNIARAFSLVGALAIIRFRTRLRSPWDITFVFFALAAGIACGVFAFNVAVLGTGVASLTVYALQVLPVTGRHKVVHLLRCDLAAYEAQEDAISGVLDQHLERRWLVEARSLRFGETLSYRYRVILKRQGRLEGLLQDLSAVEGVERVVVYHDPDGSGDTT